MAGVDPGEPRARPELGEPAAALDRTDPIPLAMDDERRSRHPWSVDRRVNLREADAKPSLRNLDHMSPGFLGFKMGQQTAFGQAGFRRERAER